MSDLHQKLREAESVVRRLRKAVRKQNREVRGLPAKREGVYFRNGHEYLPPEKKFERRVEIYRNAGGDIAIFDDVIEDLRPATCQGCVEPHLVGWFEGEWSHPKSKGERRCDCAACALFVCKPWHKRFHHRVIGA